MLSVHSIIPILKDSIIAITFLFVMLHQIRCLFLEILGILYFVLFIVIVLFILNIFVFVFVVILLFLFEFVLVVVVVIVAVFLLFGVIETEGSSLHRAQREETLREQQWVQQTVPLGLPSGPLLDAPWVRSFPLMGST